MNTTNTVQDFRRQNLRNIAKQYGGVTPLSQLLGYTNASFIVQMIGPNPMRQISEANARKYEKALDLIENSLDAPVEIPDEEVVNGDDIRTRQSTMYRKLKGLPVAAPAPAHITSDMMSREQLADIVSMVGRICGEANANISTNKFSDIIALTLLNKIDSKKDSEDFVKQLVSLTK